MVLKSQSTNGATDVGSSKQDEDVMSIASLSSASVNTLDNHADIKEVVDGHEPPLYAHVQSSVPIEQPPTYEHATSTSVSSRYTSVRGSPSIASNAPEVDDRDVGPGQDPPAPAPPSGSASFLNDKKAKIHEGDITLHKSETITGPIIITGKLQIHGKVRFIGALEVQKSITIHGTLTVDGFLRVGKDISCHGTLNVSEAAEIHGKLKNHGKVNFAKSVTHRDEIANHGQIVYDGIVDLGSAKLKNHGTVDASHGAQNVGKVSNHGKLIGLSSL